MQIYELKIGETFMIADIRITVLNIEGEEVRLQIDAPPQVPIAIDGIDMENPVQ
jgi:carbon storage regulator CsrA